MALFLFWRLAATFVTNKLVGMLNSVYNDPVDYLCFKKPHISMIINWLCDIVQIGISNCINVALLQILRRVFQKLKISKRNKYLLGNWKWKSLGRCERTSLLNWTQTRSYHPTVNYLFESPCLCFFTLNISLKSTAVPFVWPYVSAPSSLFLETRYINQRVCWDMKILYQLTRVHGVNYATHHLVLESDCIRRFSCPYFPAFGLNTEIYSVINLRIQSESGKIQTRKTVNMDTFYAVNYQYFQSNFEFTIQLYPLITKHFQKKFLLEKKCHFPILISVHWQVSMGKVNEYSDLRRSCKSRCCDTQQ